MTAPENRTGPDGCPVVEPPKGSRLTASVPLASLSATVVGVRTSGFSVEEQRGVYRENLLAILPEHTRARIGS